MTSCFSLKEFLNSKNFFLTILCCELKINSENRNLKDQILYLPYANLMACTSIGIPLLILCDVHRIQNFQRAIFYFSGKSFAAFWSQCKCALCTLTGQQSKNRSEHIKKKSYSNKTWTICMANCLSESLNTHWDSDKTDFLRDPD